MHDYNISTVEPKQCNKVPKDQENVFIITGVLFHTFFATKIFGQAEQHCSSYRGLLRPHFLGICYFEVPLYIKSVTCGSSIFNIKF